MGTAWDRDAEDAEAKSVAKIKMAGQGVVTEVKAEAPVVEAKAEGVVAAIVGELKDLEQKVENLVHPTAPETPAA